MANKDFQNGLIVGMAAGSTVIETGKGIPGGYVITFKVDGNDYYIASCLQGNSISSPEGNYLWFDENNNLIAFPYTPVADIILNGIIASKLSVLNPICSTYLNATYSPDKAFDENVNTRWATAASAGSGYIGADFGINGAVIISVNNIKSQYQWKALTLKYSDDGTNWMTASETYTNPTYSNNQFTIYSTIYSSHRYWAVFSDNSETVAEIEFYGSISDQ